MDTDRQLTKHFHLREFLCNGSPDGLTTTILVNLQRLAEALEKVREACGNHPVRINSGFRTPAHNRKIGGAPRSQHLYGRAADIVVEGVPPGQVQAILKDWDGGLGSYHAFTHVDIGAKRRWNGP